jgi:hypothetical protein
MAAHRRPTERDRENPGPAGRHVRRLLLAYDERDLAVVPDACVE